MIHLKNLLLESGLTDSLQIKGLGTVTCKWDTGADTAASALHAQDIQVRDTQVTWTYGGRTHRAHVVAYSQPKHKASRPIVELRVTWRGKTIMAPFALTDRSTMSTDALCNLDLMRQLGATVDLKTGLQ